MLNAYTSRHLFIRKEQNEEARIEECSSQSGYYLLDPSVHIKWFIFLKNVAFFLYLLRCVQMDLMQLDTECFFNSKYGWERDKCSRTLCIWIHQIAGQVPRWLLQPGGTTLCATFLYLGLTSCVMMLFALYKREQERTRSRLFNRGLKLVLVTPGITVEIFVLFFCFVGVFQSMEWRVESYVNGKSASFFVRSIIFAVLISVFLLLELALHVISVSYICQHATSLTSNNLQCSLSSPSHSVLEMCKTPANPSSKFFVGNSNSNFLGESGANASETDSIGYGRFRRVYIRDPANGEESSGHRYDLENARFRTTPALVDLSCRSDYQQINAMEGGSHFLHSPAPAHRLARGSPSLMRTNLFAQQNIPSGSSRDRTNNTYLEVV